jgi:Zn-dependent protease
MATATFQLGSIPVRVGPAFFLVAAIIGGSRLDEPLLLVTWVAVVFVSILIHELGHAAAFRAFGHSTRIELYGMGGRTFGEGRPLSTTGEVLVSLGGPVAGFLCGFVVLELSRRVGFEGRLMRVVVGDLLWVNLGWGALNLLPISALDGGHVARALLQRAAGDRGRRMAAQLAVIVSAVAVVAALWYGTAWGALLAAYFGADSYNQLGEGRDDRLLPRLSEGFRLLNESSLDEAQAIAAEGLETARTPQGLRAAVELMAWAQLRKGDPGEGLRALQRFPVDVEPTPDLLGQLLLAAGRAQDAIEPLARAWREEPTESRARRLADSVIQTRNFRRVEALFQGPAGQREDGGALAMVESAAFEAGEIEAAERIARLRFERHGDPLGAYNAACALARLGRPEDAERWLEKAIAAGFDNARTIAEDPDLAPLRHRQSFQEIVRPVLTRAE